MKGVEHTPGSCFPNGLETKVNGVVKTVTHNTAVTSVTAANGTAAAEANPTKAEFDAVVTLANSTKAQLNALLVQLRNAGIILS